MINIKIWGNLLNYQLHCYLYINIYFDRILFDHFVETLNLYSNCNKI